MVDRAYSVRLALNNYIRHIADQREWYAEAAKDGRHSQHAHFATMAQFYDDIMRATAPVISFYTAELAAASTE